jgi:hypothetical protein
MTFEELEEALEELFPAGYSIDRDEDNSQIVIYTHLVEDEDGDLIVLVEDEDDDADPDFDPLEDEDGDDD